MIGLIKGDARSLDYSSLGMPQSLRPTVDLSCWGFRGSVLEVQGVRV